MLTQKRKNLSGITKVKIKEKGGKHIENMLKKKMKKRNLKEKGITLIALVVTIIILLILAGVAIGVVTSDNGLFRKADESAKISDIADTKEQIKLELTAATLTSNKAGNYDNLDVIKAVKKVTGKDITEKTPNVESKKGNNVDISDLWVKTQETLKISVDGQIKEYKIQQGTTWRQFFDDGSVSRINQLSVELFDHTEQIPEINAYSHKYCLLVNLLYMYDSKNDRYVLKDVVPSSAMVGDSSGWCMLDIAWGDVPHNLDDVIDTSSTTLWEVNYC